MGYEVKIAGMGSTWTTATRPSSPSQGTIGFNTDSSINSFEYYNGSSWWAAGTRVLVNKVSGPGNGSISNGANGSYFTMQRYDTPFPSNTGVLVIAFKSLIESSGAGGNANNALYYRFYKNTGAASSGSYIAESSVIGSGTNIGNAGGNTNFGFRVPASFAATSTWCEVSPTIICPYTAGDIITIYCATDGANCTWAINEMQIDYMLLTNVATS